MLCVPCGYKETPNENPKQHKERTGHDDWFLEMYEVDNRPDMSEIIEP
jgi:hypothetical protein